MMNVAERKQATAPAEAQAWLARFEAALQAQDARAAARSGGPLLSERPPLCIRRCPL